MTFQDGQKAGLAVAKLSQVNESAHTFKNSTDETVEQPAPVKKSKYNFRPGVFHNLFKK